MSQTETGGKSQGTLDWMQDSTGHNNPLQGVKMATPPKVPQIEDPDNNITFTRGCAGLG